MCLCPLLQAAGRDCGVGSADDLSDLCTSGGSTGHGAPDVEKSPPGQNVSIIFSGTCEQNMLGLYENGVPKR